MFAGLRNKQQTNSILCYMMSQPTWFSIRRQKYLYYWTRNLGRRIYWESWL